MDLDKLEQQFHEAKARCVALKEGPPQNEAEELMHWVMNTDINPYGIFLDEGIANMTQSIQGLDSLSGMASHALLDDGEISFISINGKPYVVFLQANDFPDDNAFWEAVKAQDSFSGHALFPVERKMLSREVSEFIERSEAHEAEFLKTCFMLEARKNKEKAVEKYREFPRFDPAWVDPLS